MSTNIPKTFKQMLYRLGHSESGVDVTTLMYEFKQPPATVAYFCRVYATEGLITVAAQRVTLTRSGRDFVTKERTNERRRDGSTRSLIPSDKRKPMVDPFAPYLPRRPDLDPTILKRK